MSATLSICLMISHRLPTHWPKRPWRRCRRSSAVKCPHSPLTWPQALPAPAKRWVSSMTKHEQMLRVVCHLFFFLFSSCSREASMKVVITQFTTMFCHMIPAYPADMNRWPSSAVLCSRSPLCNSSLFRAAWGLTPGLWSVLHRSAIRLQWAVQQRGTSQRHLRHQT